MCVCLCVYVWAISPALVYSVCVCVFFLIAFSLSFFFMPVAFRLLLSRRPATALLKIGETEREKKNTPKDT